MENSMVGKRLSEFKFINNRISCYRDGEGKSLFTEKYNMNHYLERTIRNETEDFFEISNFSYGWFKKSDAIIGYNKNIEPNYEIY